MQPIPVQLSVRNVRKSFSGKAGGVRVLDDLSFSINERDFVSIIGPSGCGKTTIFNIIAGLIEPDSGSMHYRGEEIESLRGRVGYMMQKDLLFPWRTVLGNVLLGLETRGVDRDEAEEKAREYLKGFGRAGFENAYPKTLLDPHNARHSPSAKAENAQRAPPNQLRHPARPRGAASRGGDRLFRAVGNRRPRRMDFRLLGGIAGWYFQFRLQNDPERRAA